MLRVSSSLGEAVTEVPLSDVTDVKSLKRYLTKAGKPPRFQQRLVHQGEILEDGEMISKLEPQLLSAFPLRALTALACRKKVLKTKTSTSGLHGLFFAVCRV